MKRASIILSFIVILTFSGCWDSQELDQRSLVGGIGVDINEANEFKVISQIVPSEAAKAIVGGTISGNPDLVWNLVTESKTVVDALFKTRSITGRDPSFSHNKILIFSEELAKQGLKKGIDYFRRNEEIRRRCWILIAESNIEEIFRIENKVSLIPSFALSESMEMAASSGIVSIDLHEFSKTASCSSSCAYAPIIKLVEKKDEYKGDDSSKGNEESKDGKNELSDKILNLHSTAVFDNYKMVGTLNKIETRGLMWAKELVNVAIVNIYSPINTNELLNVTTNRLKSSIKPKLKNNKIVMEMEIEAVGYIDEKHDEALDISDPKQIKQIDIVLSEHIKKEVKAALSKSQELKADIFDFGDHIYQEYPDEWDLIKDNWKEEYSKIEVEIKCTARINWSGRIDDNG